MDIRKRFRKTIKQEVGDQADVLEESSTISEVDRAILALLEHVRQVEKSKEALLLEEYAQKYDEEGRLLTFEHQLSTALTDMETVMEEIGRKQYKFFTSRIGRKVLLADALKQPMMRASTSANDIGSIRYIERMNAQIQDEAVREYVHEVTSTLRRTYAIEDRPWRGFSVVKGVNISYWSSPPVVNETEPDWIDGRIISQGWRLSGDAFYDGYSVNHCVTIDGKTQETAEYDINGDGEIERQDGKRTGDSDKYFVLGTVLRSTEALSNRLKIVSESPRKVRRWYEQQNNETT